MKKLILCFYIIYFFAIAKGEIIIDSSKKQIPVPMKIDDYIKEVIQDKNEKEEDHYAYNAQYCNLKTEDKYMEDDNKYQSCYVSIYIQKWYYFCGKIYRKQYADKYGDKTDFVVNYISSFIKDENKKKFDDKNKKIKIDCFSRGLKYISFFSIILSILLL